MRITDVDMFGGFNSDATNAWASADCVNMLVELAEGPSRSPLKLVGAPGLKTLCELPTKPGRGAHEINGRMFVVSGNVLYEIRQDFSFIARGTIPGVGRVDMEHNQFGSGHQMLVLNGSAGYVFNTTTNTLVRITDAGFPGGHSAVFINQYLGFVEPFGRFWGHSEVANALDYNTLDRYVSEASPDKIVTIKSNQAEVVVMNRDTTEFYYNSGATTGTFKNKQITIERGAAARHGAVRLDNSILWLGNDGVFYRLNGYSAQPISTGAIESSIKDSDWSTCFAMTFESKHHKIAYWTFLDGRTYGYDVVTQLWHRRKSFGLERWRVSSLTPWNGLIIGTDFQSGRVYSLVWGHAAEAFDLLEREVIPPTLTDQGNPVSVLRIQLEVSAGGHGTELEPSPLTISGQLPDGVETDVVSFAYDASGGTAPYAFTLLSGALPTGLTLSSAGIVSGTVSAGGTFSWVARVTDALGKTADLADTAIYSNARTVVIGGQTTGGLYSFDSSPSGASFPLPIVTPSPNYSFSSLTLTSSGRVICLSGPTSIRYSDDFGATSTLVTIPTVNNAGESGILDFSGALYLPGKDAVGLLKSTDSGATWAIKGAGIAFKNLAAKTGLMLGLNTTNQPTISTDSGETWGPLGSRIDSAPYNFNPNSFGQFAATDGTLIAFAGSAFVTGIGNTPSIILTTNGVIFTVRSLNADVGVSAASVAYGNGAWVAGTSNGKVYRSVDDGATWLLVTTLPEPAKWTIHNGLFFFVTTNGAPGRIYRSMDGLTYTEVTHFMAQRMTAIAVNRPL